VCESLRIHSNVETVQVSHTYVKVNFNTSVGETGRSIDEKNSRSLVKPNGESELNARKEGWKQESSLEKCHHPLKRTFVHIHHDYYGGCN
jgi:hypothetical protein